MVRCLAQCLGIRPCVPPVGCRDGSWRGASNFRPAGNWARRGGTRARTGIAPVWKLDRRMNGQAPPVAAATTRTSSRSRSPKRSPGSTRSTRG